MTSSANSYAHFRKTDGQGQSIQEHLENVSAIASKTAEMVDLASLAATVGLLHDIGKYSEEFQNYLLSAVGRLNPDEDGYVDAGPFRFDRSSQTGQAPADDDNIMVDHICLTLPN